MFKKPLRLEDISDETFIRALTEPMPLNLNEAPRLKSLGPIDDETFIRALTDPSLLDLNDESQPGASVSPKDEKFIRDLAQKIMQRQNEKRSGHTVRVFDGREIRSVSDEVHDRMRAINQNEGAP